jgi:hypothetical protein
MTASNLVRRPKWEIAIGDPPLSPRAAFLIAERRAASLVPDSVRFKPQEVSLKNVLGIWFYVVQLEPSSPRSPYTSSPMEPIKIAVMMDGTLADRIQQPKIE